MKNLITFIMVSFFLLIAVNGFGYEGQKSMATGNSYFDMATGHKYVKNSDNSYTEYTRKGELFKTNVPNTQPHLSSSHYIVEIVKDSYLVYTQYKGNKLVSQALSSSVQHLGKWQCTGMLLPVKKPS